MISAIGVSEVNPSNFPSDRVSNGIVINQIYLLTGKNTYFWHCKQLGSLLSHFVFRRRQYKQTLSARGGLGLLGPVLWDCRPSSIARSPDVSMFNNIVCNDDWPSIKGLGYFCQTSGHAGFRNNGIGARPTTIINVNRPAESGRKRFNTK
jgi:hypothetical protein